MNATWADKRLANGRVYVSVAPELILEPCATICHRSHCDQIPHIGLFQIKYQRKVLRNSLTVLQVFGAWRNDFSTSLVSVRMSSWLLVAVEPFNLISHDLQLIGFF